MKAFLMPRFAKLSLLLIILAVLLGFAFLYKTAVAPIEPVNNQPSPPTNTFTNDKVTVTTQWVNGTLKYQGLIQLPTPCYEFSHEAKVLESFPEQVHIDLKFKEPSAETVCIQILEERNFSGEVKVSEQAQVSVFLNGEEVS